MVSAAFVKRIILVCSFGKVRRGNRSRIQGLRPTRQRNRPGCGRDYRRGVWQDHEFARERSAHATAGNRSKTDFKSLYYPLFTEADAAAKNLPANYTLTDVEKADLPAIQYGEFLTTVLDFFILALCVFVMVKLMNMAMRRLLQEEKAAEAAAKAPELSLSEKLLMEIRDELKARGASPNP